MSRCVIHADEKKGDEYSLLVEGTDFLSVMAQFGIDGRRTAFNNALVVAEVDLHYAFTLVFKLLVDISHT